VTFIDRAPGRTFLAPRKWRGDSGPQVRLASVVTLGKTSHRFATDHHLQPRIFENLASIHVRCPFLCLIDSIGGAFRLYCYVQIGDQMSLVHLAKRCGELRHDCPLLSANHRREIGAARANVKPFIFQTETSAAGDDGLPLDRWRATNLDDARVVVRSLPARSQSSDVWLHAGELMLEAVTVRGPIRETAAQLRRALRADGLL
jgi:hypothetical protein